ncbi:SDR family oxidoreductase [Catenulispora sp. NF23]|uniref:SDR family oxidoreductase n=1 Tax=Catenulispora pinistramenti TaxID=2705254 RepID=A0ABS5KLA3_9ACTN|nr:SDR family oxidoreductase [Catenulispora pinistramenti]MBS2531541.1 SDR family oxidoreductase [Catenulispora pinistramenti]MBS2546810.1 SDR family oxidoreductase [Catenulispora pinistramenti]
MRVLVTGASGHIAAAVIPELLGAGHQVVGLARSEASAELVAARGAEVRRGDLDDPDSLRAAAADAQGVIHLAARSLRDGDFAAVLAAHLRAIEVIGDTLAGTDQPFVVVGGTLMLPFAGITGRPGTEQDVLETGPGAAPEAAIMALAGRGVRSSVLRLPPVVHSTLDRTGFVPTLIATARAKGVSGYVGDGANRWAAVHTLDAARALRLALEKAKPGSRLHPVADTGIAFRELAEAIGRHLDLPVKSIPAEDAAEHFGGIGAFVGVDNPVSSTHTRQLLGWEPTHPGLIADLDEGHYFAGSAADRQAR